MQCNVGEDEAKGRKWLCKVEGVGGQRKYAVQNHQWKFNLEPHVHAIPPT